MFTYYRSAYNCLTLVHHQITVSNIPGAPHPAKLSKENKEDLLEEKFVSCEPSCGHKVQCSLCLHPHPKPQVLEEVELGVRVLNLRPDSFTRPRPLIQKDCWTARKCSSFLVVSSRTSGQGTKLPTPPLLFINRAVSTNIYRPLGLH